MRRITISGCTMLSGAVQLIGTVEFAPLAVRDRLLPDERVDLPITGKRDEMGVLERIGLRKAEEQSGKTLGGRIVKVAPGDTLGEDRLA